MLSKGGHCKGQIAHSDWVGPPQNSCYANTTLGISRHSAYTTYITCSHNLDVLEH